MGFAQWMRVIDTVGGLAQVVGRLRRETDAPVGLQASSTGGPLGQLETRLAGVLVSALQEAFNRDSARLELERSQIEAERRRAEEALRTELRRQTAERLSGQLKLVAVMAMIGWALSAALGALLPGLREGAPRLLLGAGWLLAFSALGCAFAGWQSISAWSARLQGSEIDVPQSAAITAAPWLLISALIVIGLAVLGGL